MNIRHASTKIVLLLILCIVGAMPTQAQRKKTSNKAKPKVEQVETVVVEDTFDEPVERITFIDSLVIDHASLLPSLMLTKESGSIVSASTFMTNLGDEAKQFAIEDGATAYINAFGNQAYLALIDSTGCPNLYTTILTLGKWSRPQRLEGLEVGTIRYSHPFLMPDGVTLYFSAENGDEAVGAKDIYVTRYNSATHTYLRPERLARPFCSDGDDFLYAIDELSSVGFFVTNRHLSGDSLCIYQFIPTESPEFYNPDTTSAQALRQAAEIHSIAATQWDQSLVDEHRRQRLRALESANADANRFRFVVNDAQVCHYTRDFKTATARRIVPQWVERQRELQEAETKLDKMRRQYGKTRESSLATAITKQERTVAELRTTVKALAKNIRKAELAK